MLLYVLYEQAVGYALFEVIEFEEIGSFLPQIESSATDRNRFNQIVKLKAFAPFESASDALEAVNSLPEGIVPDGLKSFLDQNFPKCEERKPTLGVLNGNLAVNISETLGIKCTRGGVVADVARGTDIAPIDLENVLNFSHRLLELMDCRDSVQQYLKKGLAPVAPNLSALMGELIAARLISRAGSLLNLAKLPGGTIQILGAEKAMSRARKTGCNPPKYGVLHNSTFIGRASGQNKGKISRFIGNKCGFAARMDYFSEKSSNAYGEKLRQEVEDRLTSLETGILPPKKADVMDQAAEEDSEFEDCDDN